MPGPRYPISYGTVARETGGRVWFSSIVEDPPSEYPYLLLCTEHQVTARFRKSADASAHKSHPTVWCMACRRINQSEHRPVSLVVSDWRNDLCVVISLW